MKCGNLRENVGLNSTCHVTLRSFVSGEKGLCH